MEKKTLKLKFSIDGGFVTRTARDWFYYEDKPYEVVEELLLDCMCGTDIPTGELKFMAQNILLGKAEFQGNSGDGTFRYVSLETPAEKNIFKEYSNLRIEKAKLKTEFNEIRDRLLNLLDAIIACTWESGEEALNHIFFNEDKRIFKDMLLHYGENVQETKFFSSIPLVDSYLKAQKTENNYGWLAPNGEFFPVQWCEHQEWAQLKIEQLGLTDEFEKYCEERTFLFSYGDFLCTKGWILLHNPALGVAKVSRNPEKRITKAQSEFLFNYYTERGENDLAKEYLN